MNLKKTLATTLVVAFVITAVPNTYAFSFGEFFGRGNKSEVEQTDKKGFSQKFRHGNRGAQTKHANFELPAEIQTLIEQLKAARDADDTELVEQIRAELQEIKSGFRTAGNKFGQKNHVGIGHGAINAETQALLDELREARQNGDEAKIIELTEQLKTQREIQKAERQTAIDEALAGGYEAWKTYATEQEMPVGLLEKITADNFSTFVELHEMKEKVQALQAELGIQGNHLMIRGR